jgi:hypothetical protein
MLGFHFVSFYFVISQIVRSVSYTLKILEHRKAAGKFRYFMVLRQIRRIRRSLPPTALLMQVVSLVLTATPARLRYRGACGYPGKLDASFAVCTDCCGQVIRLSSTLGARQHIARWLTFGSWLPSV